MSSMFMIFDMVDEKTFGLNYAFSFNGHLMYTNMYICFTEVLHCHDRNYYCVLN